MGHYYCGCFETRTLGRLGSMVVERISMGRRRWSVRDSILTSHLSDA
jgi:hypothetical protein